MSSKEGRGGPRRGKGGAGAGGPGKSARAGKEKPAVDRRKQDGGQKGGADAARGRAGERGSGGAGAGKPGEGQQGPSGGRGRPGNRGSGERPGGSGGGPPAKTRAGAPASGSRAGRKYDSGAADGARQAAGDQAPKAAQGGGRPGGRGQRSAADGGARPAGRGGARKGGGRPAERKGQGRPAGRRDGKPDRSRQGDADRSSRSAEPRLPEGVDAVEPSRELRRELRSLPRDLADRVGGHLAAAELLVESDPEQAYAHAQAAVRRAGRLAIAREVCGTTAYATGRWSEAARELRAARRLGSVSELLPLIADCERGLGRPERALTMAASKEAAQLGDAARTELLIVAAGARRDLGQLDAALVLLQVPELKARSKASWQLRLRYAYADLLEAARRGDEAVSWFDRVAAADPEWQTDAAVRAAQLRGEPAPAPPRQTERDDDTEIVDLGD